LNRGCSMTSDDLMVPEKKVVLVTGGGRGIGAATARLAHQKGWSVCINYRSRNDAAEKLADEINASGGIAISVKADVSREKDVISLFDTVDNQLGMIHALINNAGVITPQSQLVDMDADRLRKIFDTNVIGSFLCAGEAVKRMATSKGGSGGSIINLSSIAARIGSPHEFIDYAASKGAIDTMTIGLSKEVAEEGIRVNAVRPGLIETELHRDTGDIDRPQKLKEFIPVKRVGSASEVANAIVWLMSDEASYVTGALVDVAGGR